MISVQNLNSLLTIELTIECLEGAVIEGVIVDTVLEKLPPQKQFNGEKNNEKTSYSITAAGIGNLQLSLSVELRAILNIFEESSAVVY